MKHLNYRSGDSLLNQIDKTVVKENSLALWHLGQESIVIKGKSEKILYFDPYLSNSIEESGGPPRNFEPPLDPSMITNVDYLFITHQHPDHLDSDTIGPMSQASPQAKFIVPAAHVNVLKEIGIEASRIIPINAGTTKQVDGMNIHAFAGKHVEFEVDAAGNHAYLGYVVEMDGICFYHAGDTVIYPELIEQVKKHTIDIAYVPINGGDYFRTRQGIIGNMNHREAIEFTVEIGADLMIPCHYDLMEENYENPSYFVDYLFKHFRDQKFKMMIPGERLLYLKEE